MPNYGNDPNYLIRQTLDYKKKGRGVGWDSGRFNGRKHGRVPKRRQSATSGFQVLASGAEASERLFVVPQLRKSPALTAS